MENQQSFGLLGRKLGHSYSKIIHNLLGRYSYELFEVEPDKLEQFINSKVNGFNVTIPYKKEIIKFLTSIDDKASSIGAVNTVVKLKSGFKGYNTDFDGMVYMLNRAKITVKDKVVMILGSGGTSNTAISVCKHLGAKKIAVVSRSGEINYHNYITQQDTQIIINTTPVGMYPDNYSCPIDLSSFLKLESVADVIYNPSMTLLCHKAERLGLKTTNGLPMLVAQAKRAKELFKGRKVSDKCVENIIEKIKKQKQNIILIGMPGCGKTTIGRRLSELLGKQFIDTDLEIEKRENLDIPTIFKVKGEQYFRAVEKQVIKDVCKLNEAVISTGGGIVKDEDNLYPLVSNGKVFWIQRDIANLDESNRPLSTSLKEVEKIYQQRKDLYSAFSHFKIYNDKTVEQAVKGVIGKL